MMGDRERILQKVEEKTGVTRKELWAPKGFKNITSARRVFQICMRMLGWSTTKIGNWMGKDHSSVAFNTTHAKDEEKAMATEIMEELGIEPKKLLTADEYNRLKKFEAEEQKRKYEHKPVYVKKIVPDYQNYVIKTVWEKKWKNTSTRGILKDGALRVPADL